ncbi:MAG TPA: hypothetical protein VEJ46_05155 [Candidatus Acidoferrum sp.]|nr:hypothetical protein [Candidatus Acidoferrum sp.]
MNRILRTLFLLLWIVFGLALILVPWSSIWDANYFLYQYPALGLVLKNSYFRGAISGLGFMNVLLSLEGFRRRTASVAKRS